MQSERHLERSQLARCGSLGSLVTRGTGLGSRQSIVCPSSIIKSDRPTTGPAGRCHAIIPLERITSRGTSMAAIVEQVAVQADLDAANEGLPATDSRLKIQVVTL